VNKRLPRWLGNLLAPADDPRRGVVDEATCGDPETLLASLRRSRAELSQLRAQISNRTGASRMLEELAHEEQALLEAEANLLVSLDERRARAALLNARRRATEAELWTEL
jgi:hypothetical protein